MYQISFDSHKDNHKKAHLVRIRIHMQALLVLPNVSANKQVSEKTLQTQPKL
jgi:hypothetical protein